MHVRPPGTDFAGTPAQSGLASSCIGQEKHPSFTCKRVQSQAHTDARMCMRALITVERHRSTPSSYLVGPHAVVVLENLPGISEVRVEHEGLYRAILSYRWKDPGTH